MGPLGVVEVDPLADDPLGMEAVDQAAIRDGFVGFNVICMKPGDPTMVVRRIKKLLG